jgi:mRNA interferase HigB
MRVISKKPLREFWEKHADAKAALQAWYEDALRAEWRTPGEIKDRYGNASIIGDNCVVFNIKGNDHRLVVKLHYDCGTAYVRFVGTHREYDRIDAETI